MAKRNRTPLACAHCGKEFPRVACAGLFCGDDCAKEHATQMEKATVDLQAAGFEQHAEAPNLWVKEGHAISVEHVKQIGIEKALNIHARHAAGAQLAG
jgi:hypothetical protein